MPVRPLASHSADSFCQSHLTDAVALPCLCPHVALRGCSDDQKIKILRDLVVGALPSLSSAGQGGPREFTFLSFGSHMITAHMDLLLRAFPASPWIYFFE